MQVVFADRADAGADHAHRNLVRLQRLETIHNGGQRALDVGFDDDVELLQLVVAVDDANQFGAADVQMAAFGLALAGGLGGLDAGDFFVGDDIELITELRQSLETADSHRRGRRSLLEGLAVGGLQIADLGIGGASYDKVAALESAGLHQGVGDRPAALLNMGLDDQAAGRHVDVGLELVDVGDQQQHVEQFRYALFGLGGHRHDYGIAAPFFGKQ